MTTDIEFALLEAPPFRLRFLCGRHASTTVAWLCAQDLAYLLELPGWRRVPCRVHFRARLPQRLVRRLWRGGFGQLPSGEPHLAPDGLMVFAPIGLSRVAAAATALWGGRYNPMKHGQAADVPNQPALALEASRDHFAHAWVPGASMGQPVQAAHALDSPGTGDPRGVPVQAAHALDSPGTGDPRGVPVQAAHALGVDSHILGGVGNHMLRDGGSHTLRGVGNHMLGDVGKKMLDVGGTLPSWRSHLRNTGFNFGKVGLGTLAHRMGQNLRWEHLEKVGLGSLVPEQQGSAIQEVEHKLTVQSHPRRVNQRALEPIQYTLPSNLGGEKSMTQSEVQIMLGAGKKYGMEIIASQDTSKRFAEIVVNKEPWLMSHESWNSLIGNAGAARDFAYDSTRTKTKQVLAWATTMSDSDVQKWSDLITTGVQDYMPENWGHWETIRGVGALAASAAGLPVVAGALQYAPVATGPVQFVINNAEGQFTMANITWMIDADTGHCEDLPTCLVSVLGAHEFEKQIPKTRGHISKLKKTMNFPNCWAKLCTAHEASHQTVRGGAKNSLLRLKGLFEMIKTENKPDKAELAEVMAKAKEEGDGGCKLFKEAMNDFEQKVNNAKNELGLDITQSIEQMKNVNPTVSDIVIHSLAEAIKKHYDLQQLPERKKFIANMNKWLKAVGDMEHARFVLDLCHEKLQTYYTESKKYIDQVQANELFVAGSVIKQILDGDSNNEQRGLSENDKITLKRMLARYLHVDTQDLTADESDQMEFNNYIYFSRNATKSFRVGRLQKVYEKAREIHQDKNALKKQEEANTKSSSELSSSTLLNTILLGLNSILFYGAWSSKKDKERLVMMLEATREFSEGAFDAWNKKATRNTDTMKAYAEAARQGVITALQTIDDMLIEQTKVMTAQFKAAMGSIEQEHTGHSEILVCYGVLLSLYSTCAGLEKAINIVFMRVDKMIEWLSSAGNTLQDMTSGRSPFKKIMGGLAKINEFRREISFLGSGGKLLMPHLEMLGGWFYTMSTAVLSMKARLGSITRVLKIAACHPDSRICNVEKDGLTPIQNAVGKCTQAVSMISDLEWKKLHISGVNKSGGSTNQGAKGENFISNGIGEVIQIEKLYKMESLKKYNNFRQQIVNKIEEVRTKLSNQDHNRSAQSTDDMDIQAAINFNEKFQEKFKETFKIENHKNIDSETSVLQAVINQFAAPSSLKIIPKQREQKTEYYKIDEDSE